MELSGLGYYPNPLAPDPAEARIYTDHIRKVIEAARTLGLGVVNTIVGSDWTKSVEDNWSRFRDTWKPLIAFAEEKGVKIAIENCPMLFTRDEWPGGKTSRARCRRADCAGHEVPGRAAGSHRDPAQAPLP